jgi:hypothetical protein
MAIARLRSAEELVLTAYRQDLRPLQSGGLIRDWNLLKDIQLHHQAFNGFRSFGDRVGDKVEGLIDRLIERSERKRNKNEGAADIGAQGPGRFD